MTLMEHVRSALRGRTRIGIAWIFAIILAVSTTQAPTLPGIILCFLGAALRIWAGGYLRKDSRPAVGGPYRFTRNPLYLGTYLMALGLALAIEAYVLLLVMSVVFAFLYHFIILDEEIKLEELFGEPYNQYKKLVPRFFPGTGFLKHANQLMINPDADAAGFSTPLALKNKALDAIASFIGLIGAVSLIAYFRQ
jgi:hypothetical protein